MDIFEVTRRAQEAVTEIYALISRRFKDNPDLRALFLMLAEEERQNLRRIGALGEALDSGEVVWQLTTEFEPLLELMEQAEGMLIAFLQREELTPHDAFVAATTLERELHAVRTMLLDLAFDREMRGLFSELLRVGPGHEELFKRLARGSYDLSPEARKRHQTLSRKALAADAARRDTLEDVPIPDMDQLT